LAGNGKNDRKTTSSGITSGATGYFLLLLIVFICAFFFRTWCGVQCIRTGYEISEAEQRQEELLDMKENLKVEVARLTAPETLSRLAETRFDLITPKPEQIVVIP